MEVQIVSPIRGPAVSYDVGEVADVDDDTAKAWIDSGSAREYVEVETAEAPEPVEAETADAEEQPKPTRRRRRVANSDDS